MRNFIIILFFSPILVYTQGCDSLQWPPSSLIFGPFSVDTLYESSGIRNGPDYHGSTIFYPDTSLTDPFSSIVLVPGFSNTELTIQNWGPFLASYGIVTMTIGTNTLLDSHIQRRDALLDAVISLQDENTRNSSPLYGLLDVNSIGVGGFSKGGGGAQLAASLNDSLKTVVALYPWLENPSSTDLLHQVPVIIISGQLDLIAPPSLHADIHYNYTPNTTKKLIYEILGASHDPLSGPYAGAGEVGIRVLSWLQTYLVDDSCYCPSLLTVPLSSSSYMTNILCEDITYTEENYIIKKRVLRTIDVLGRSVHIRNNDLLFYIYDDGTVEKRITIE